MRYPVAAFALRLRRPGFMLIREGDVVNQASDHLHAARTNGFVKSRLVILACLIALPVPAVAQVPPVPAMLGPAVVVLHTSGHVPQPGGSVALLLADGSRLVVAATDIDEALTRSANDSLSGKHARGRATVVAIHITARVPDPDGSIAVLLASGSRIVFAASYIDAELTRSINNRISVERAGEARRRINHSGFLDQSRLSSRQPRRFSPPRRLSATPTPAVQFWHCRLR